MSFIVKGYADTESLHTAGRPPKRPSRRHANYEVHIVTRKAETTPHPSSAIFRDRPSHRALFRSDGRVSTSRHDQQSSAALPIGS